MNPERWRRINEIFEAALARPLDERACFVEHTCAGELELQRTVVAMLIADRKQNLMVDRPAYTAVGSFLPSIIEGVDSENFTGAMIGVYRLIKEIGSGGMGTVYLAYDVHLKRQAALKVLPSQFNSIDRGRRLEREARSASALNHPHIITIYDFGQENGRSFIASEFVEGRTLRDYVGTPELTLNKILEIGSQVASALDTAHAAGIIHRDIKPENIMLRPDGYSKVLDFGLAKLTEAEITGVQTKTVGSQLTSVFETKAGAVLGTVNYMSPEQVRGQKLDGRSDLFSLGVVLYELIAGHRPFDGETWHHTMVAITDREPPPLEKYLSEVPQGLQELIDQALGKDRDERYQSARDLLQDLENTLCDLESNTRLKRLAPERDAVQRISQQPTTLLPASGSLTADRRKLRLKGRRRSTVVAQLKKHWLLISIIAALLIAVAGYSYFSHRAHSASAVMTAKDAILLADFINTTGDADFDGTLKQGLTVQLAQSPYINIYPEERARETLKLMERPRDEKITRDVGREICQRRGIKVLIVGTVAPLGRNYVITLEALNSQSGESVAQQQTEAEDKEHVLKALGGASTEIRKKLGESLASIERFDVPIDQATTTSLEALKNFTSGVELRSKGQYAQSIPPFKRAVEFDSDFALAHSLLGTSYRDVRNLALGNKHLQRAYELRDRVSERERLEISATYFRHVTGELDKRLEMSALLTRTYPQYANAFHIHGNSLIIAGDFEQAADAYREALRLDPYYALSRVNLALALIGQNRFDEAERVVQEGIDRGIDSPGVHNRLYLLGFFKHDEQLMQRQVQWFAGRSDEFQIRELQARVLAFSGRRQEASKTFANELALAEAQGLRAEKARILSVDAALNATFGLTELARKQAGGLLKVLAQDHISPEELQPSLIQQLDAQPLAWTMALCGDQREAQTLEEDFTKKFPLDTIHNSVWMPVIRATLELKSGANQNRADSLLPARQYEAALSFRPTWVRGLAYLHEKNGALAAVEFQQIIDHRGWDVFSPLWPLAHLGLARASVLEGDVAAARKHYEEFFELWKDADGDLPILIDARREYDKLKTS
jgi:eukaryotic-like serine/threonine-protein kinase